MNPRNLSIDQFSYPLPPERIAEFPLANRDSSKLLLFRNDQISEDVFRNIAKWLPPSSTMIFNDTKVVEARLHFQKPTGATIEIFCLEPDDRYPDITTAFSQTHEVFWKCLVGNAASWTSGLTLNKIIGDGLSIEARMIQKEKEHFLIHLSWEANVSFAEVLHHAGQIPLPPYIKRKTETSDKERYQTIYAQYPGSVAAPTAGLHFTTHVLEQLQQKNISRNFVTLHVGAGTFKPVKSETLAGHSMHAEFFEVSRSLIENLIDARSNSIIAVGTTSLRTLESLYWIGVKIFNDSNLETDGLNVTQWEPYESNPSVSVGDSLQAILTWMQKHDTDLLIAKTSLLIAPPYQFRIVSALVTNFHQPRSTLLLLVAAFIGEKWRDAYAYALEHDFRFLSYGDSCLFFRQ